MNLFQRSGSGVDLELYINDDMGLPLVQFRHASERPRMEAVPLTPAAPIAEPKPWQCKQGRGPFVTYSEDPATSAVYRRFITCLVVLLLAVLAINTFATAQAQTVGLHLYSKHANDTHLVTHEGGDPTVKAFNEKNVGLYYIHRPVDLWGVSARPVVGVFDNSYFHTTVYLGLNRDWRVWGPLSVGGTAALATGYRTVHGVGLLRPIFMPHVVLDLPHGVAVRYSITPAKGGVFQHLAIEKDL